jgi:two-component system, NtrC family, sensor kinase
MDLELQSIFFSHGIILFVFKDLGILPYNNFTRYTITMGVALQAIILSIALADRINTLNDQKEDSDQRVIDEVKKNEELVINQNIVLEKKVKERTLELEQALNSLKAAQSRLVQSEKMASLGVLTAGIAHEINNPINFVSANVIPLKENIEILTKLLKEYKQINVTNPIEELERIERMEEELELDYLLKETDLLIDGIEEGARRTHSIVDGLKTFSRGDGSELALADINTGINSTLSVLKSKANGIKVNLMLDKNLPLLYCQIGKLNQVFLNLINNALDALDEEYGANSKNSSISITTFLDKKNNVCIAVKDNAAGISAENIKKLFEPFFTTKAIGKGTGLGLAISYGIVEEHGGTITIDSEVGKGTTFVVIIPQTRS